MAVGVASFEEHPVSLLLVCRLCPMNRAGLGSQEDIVDMSVCDCSRVIGEKDASTLPFLVT